MRIFTRTIYLKTQISSQVLINFSIFFYLVTYRMWTLERSRCLFDFSKTKEQNYFLLANLWSKQISLPCRGVIIRYERLKEASAYSTFEVFLGRLLDVEAQKILNCVLLLNFESGFVNVVFSREMRSKINNIIYCLT